MLGPCHWLRAWSTVAICARVLARLAPQHPCGSTLSHRWDGVHASVAGWDRPSSRTPSSVPLDYAWRMALVAMP